MFRFEDPSYFWLFVSIPILIGLMVMSTLHRKRKIKRFGNPNIVKKLAPNLSYKRGYVKFVLYLCVVSFIIVMLARPQMGVKLSKEKQSGIETIICLDVSNSMNCRDIMPSRLDKSKLLIENLVDNFTKNKIGLVIFAGDAFLQLPITSDFISAKMFLDNLETSAISNQGTNIKDAINLASKSFTKDNRGGKAIILITDGEDHEGGAYEAAEQARKKGINLFVLGVGTANGGLISTKSGYLKDRNGEEVVTKLNENMCAKLAKAGDGVYIHLDNTDSAQQQLNNELSKLSTGDGNEFLYSEYNEQFQGFALLALILLTIDVFILERKRNGK